MKKILFSVLLFVATFANALSIGDTTPTFEIKDQFEKMHKISADTKTILVAESRSTSVIVREYLLTKDTNFLETNKTQYIADISGMPSLISKFIALPKMKKYPFPILLVNEEQAKSFSTKDDEITVYTIVEGKVSDVKYIKTTEELDAVFK
ncbi:hypothetical protein [Poseidonibacter ostreae]|jgi:hypothetical protein|uniref:FAD/FMN-containing dehydrogenase n=1 Tax=Poseidonibacter ostreae TaxID=2654171 RepID=A0A6L4WVV5_9BACT|nr:hypothetical protein [Poseidonibacter ostreae]KAB7889995.1 hypothetical protein GBG19_04490 [Poseidonibacter ostreae]KAB7891509.1 hypothetical protein GBG18_07050 [Poseidonibacter ostreae]MAC83071.1 hypothetical protein [Arcobacter sp.]|tara:strand:+ start:2040 stop:2492 length:453 start_codon:yes stop_codon:yes gene_type:complete